MLTIYHNPRCSKSRQTLELINQANAEVTIVEYLKTPLNKSEITGLLAALSVTPKEMMRTKEAEFKEQNLTEATDEQLIMAMVNTPKLMERPIVTKGDKAIIGRPPENVQSLL